MKEDLKTGFTNEEKGKNIFYDPLIHWFRIIPQYAHSHVHLFLESSQNVDILDLASFAVLVGRVLVNEHFLGSIHIFLYLRYISRNFTSYLKPDTLD